MKKSLVILVLALAAFTDGDTPAVYRKIQNLFVGKWVMHTKVASTFEEWKKVDAKQLHGRSWRVKASDTAQLETVVLNLSGDGIFYTPTVPDQNEAQPVVFKLSQSEGTRFTFSNPQHDFPQRITYEFVNRDSLHAWIEGIYTVGATPTKEIRRDFYYSRVR